MENVETVITMRTDTGGQQDPEAVYEFVEDEAELDGLFGVFEKLLDDADVNLEK